MNLGGRIQELMVEQGLSQAELARRVGISQPAIYGIINKNKIGSRYLHKIAQALGTTPAYLDGETEDRSSEVPDEYLTYEEREWALSLGRLDRKARETVLALVELLERRGGAPEGETLHESQLEYRKAG